MSILCTKRDSSNKKLGDNVRATYRKVGQTCPQECNLLNNGCYAQKGLVALHSGKKSEYSESDGEILYKWLKEMPDNKKIRHHVSGDFLHDNEIDHEYIDYMIKGHKERPDLDGWSYTHAWQRDEMDPLKLNDEDNLCVNASADSLDDAIEAKQQGWPVTVVVPEDTEEAYLEYEGERVVVCPAQRKEEVSCSDCMMCANSDRESIVAFKKH